MDFPPKGFLTMKTLLWIVVVALVLIPVVFFFGNIHDKSFRDGAIGNWFGTALGVLVGVPIGLEVARVQQNAQLKEDARKEQAKREGRLNSIRQRLYAELRYNSDVVTKVAEILSQSSARRDLWDCAVQGVDAVEFEAYRDLDAMLLPEERVYYGTFDLAYSGLRRAVNKVRQSRAGFDFLIGYSGNYTEASKQLNETRTLVEAMRIMLDTAIRELEELDHQQA